MSQIHPQDQQRIEQLHGAASADIEERLISLQDASYELGRQRGQAEGKAQRDELLEALKEIAADYADRFDLDSPSTNPGIKSTIKQARSVIAKATGSAA